MGKKKEIIIMRVGTEFKDFLQEKAKGQGVTLTRLIVRGLQKTYSTKGPGISAKPGSAQTPGAPQTPARPIESTVPKPVYASPPPPPPPPPPVSAVEKKQERLFRWKKLEEPPVVRDFQTNIADLFTDAVTPESKDPSYQAVVLMGWIERFLSETSKYFDTLPNEKRKEAAHNLIRLGETLIQGLIPVIKTKDIGQQPRT